METEKSRIFFSYARADEEFALKLAKSLRSAGANLWIDQLDIPVGSRWDRAVMQALKTAESVLVILSPAAVDSDNVMDEVSFALEQKKPVMPVLYKNCEVPLGLRRVQYIDFTVDFNLALRRLLHAFSIEPPSREPQPVEPISGEPREIRPPMKTSVSIPDQADLELESSPAGEEVETVAVGRKAFTNGIGMKFVLIPAGTFMMGSPGAEVGREGDEVPHKVTITRAFYLQTTPVTQGQWERVTGNNPSRFKDAGDKCPVEKICWDEAQQFIEKLNKMEGTDKYRFPTEAEWEYACRAGGAERFCFGDEEGKLGEYAWYRGNSGKRTHPVGNKKANAWGLYDMHGNVWEWCQDCYGDYPAGPVTDPKGSPSCEFRVSRGGSWFDNASDIRSAHRGWGWPSNRVNNLGFRLAWDL